jgi:hypothetical protein
MASSPQLHALDRLTLLPTASFQIFFIMLHHPGRVRRGRLVAISGQARRLLARGRNTFGSGKGSRAGSFSTIL